MGVTSHRKITATHFGLDFHGVRQGERLMMQ